jgi:hypothetical protein
VSSAVTLATKKGTQKATAAVFRLVLATVTAWVRTASDPNARIFCQNDVIRAHAQTLISGSRKAVGGTGTGTAFQSLPMLLFRELSPHPLDLFRSWAHLRSHSGQHYSEPFDDR